MKLMSPAHRVTALSRFVVLRSAIAGAMIFALTASAADPITYFVLRKQADGTGKSIPYGFCKPRPYNAGQKYPMVIAFHGMAPADSTNWQSKISSSVECYTWASDAFQATHSCFVVCPITPLPTWDGTIYASGGVSWNGVNYPGWSGSCPKMADTVAFPTRCVMKALDSLIREFPAIDTNRVYLVGGSMGGVGTYCTGVRYHNRFAALWPIAGLCDPARACSLKTVPLWTVHGTGDGIVSDVCDSLFVKAIVACGGNPKRNWVAGAGHGPFDWFTHTDIQQWLFSQSKSPTGIADRAAPQPQRIARRTMRVAIAPIAGLSRWYDTAGRTVVRGAGSFSTAPHIAILDDDARAGEVDSRKLLR